MMDWNPKTPSLWDLENLVLFNGKACETPNQLTPTEDWGIDIGSSSKSSISVDDAEKKAPQFSFQTIEGHPKDFRKNNDLGASGEPLTGLKLGRRTYLEDVSSSPPTNSAKKSRASCICQVEGCNVDLTGAKDYHRKHRVCESHSKCPKVIVSGLERRFCQQCSRFHELSEFDEKKRSCRRRLSDHNARRRKPQLNTISFGSGRLSSFYGLEASTITSNLGAMPEIGRALSLLSTSTGGLSDSLGQIMHANHTSVARLTMQAGYQGLPLASSGFLQSEHPSAEPLVPSLASHNNGNQLQEFQLFEAPFESAFLDNLMH